eukprot:Clim_evm4s3 gene=Clim_evmTU4s3
MYLPRSPKRAAAIIRDRQVLSVVEETAKLRKKEISMDEREIMNLVEKLKLLSEDQSAQVLKHAIGNDCGIDDMIYNECVRASKARLDENGKVLPEVESKSGDSLVLPEGGYVKCRDPSDLQRDYDQVERDLSRTWVGNSYIGDFEAEEGAYTPDLAPEQILRARVRELLRAFSYYSPMGYVQGMNQIAALLCRHLDQLDAFVLMVNLLDGHTAFQHISLQHLWRPIRQNAPSSPGLHARNRKVPHCQPSASNSCQRHSNAGGACPPSPKLSPRSKQGRRLSLVSQCYSMNGEAIEFYFHVFESVLESKLPSLYSRMVVHDISPMQYLLRWILTLFTTALPSEWVVLDIWKGYAILGDVMLIRTALAILDLLSDKILEAEPEDILQILQERPKQLKAGDISKLAWQSDLQSDMWYYMVEREQIRSDLSPGAKEMEKELE